MLGEKSQSQRLLTYCRILMVGMSNTSCIHGDRKQVCGGDVEEWVWMLDGYEPFIWGDGNVLELDGGDGCKALWVACCYWTVNLKMVKMVNLMFCVFYSNNDNN